MADSQTTCASTPIAIIGMAGLFPNAPGLKEYWRLLRCGLDGITEVPSTHWSAEDYFDPDPRAPDRTYCRRGGFLGQTRFDPSEFGIPPSALEATDTSQLLGLVAARAALEDAGYAAAPSDVQAGRLRLFDRSRASVILGVTGTQELVIPLGARLGHPIWRRALREAGVSADLADDVVRRIADAYVSWQESSFPGLLGNVVAGRIANRLDLRGTNCVVDAACASSLAALHLAAMELAAGRADLVISGGVDALNDIFMHMCFSKTPALSATGDARPFAHDADGTVLGEGVGLVVLKRLADAERDGDRIYAVIRGIGASSDGRQNSIYAPDADGQSVALRRAYAAADIDPQTVELIEAHGTGTKVGDVVEFEALCAVFDGDAASPAGAAAALPAPAAPRRWRCAVGSVKSQIGHTKAAAGAAGVIKAALALYHRVLPPTIKVSRPNPKLRLDERSLYVNTQARPWLPTQPHPRRAGVSSFGFGGSNFHVVLEEHVAAGEPSPAEPANPVPREPAWDGSVEIVALSAEDPPALLAELDALTACAAAAATWEAVARRAAETRQAFRASHRWRLTLVVERGELQGAAADGDGRDPGVARFHAALTLARDELLRQPETPWTMPGAYCGGPQPPGTLAVLFAGQGSQYVGMGRELTSVFPTALDAVAAADCAFRGESGGAAAGDAADGLGGYVYPPAAFDEARREAQQAALSRTEVAQPALAAVDAAMWGVLEYFGVRAHAFAGHSFGELVALHAAGRIDAGTLNRLACLRGRAMAASDGRAPRGAMTAVEAPLEQIESLLAECGVGVELANHNTPTQGVISGDEEAIARAERACRARGWRTRRLNVSGAFHSRWMTAAADAFRVGLRGVEWSAGAAPVYSNVTGQAYPAGAAECRRLLASQIHSPVRFVSLVENLYDSGVRTFVEVGPRCVLSGMVRAILDGRPHEALAVDASGGRRSGLVDLARCLAQLAAGGIPLRLERWERCRPAPREPRMVVPLTGANYRAPRSGATSPGLGDAGSTAAPMPAVGHEPRRRPMPRRAATDAAADGDSVRPDTKVPAPRASTMPTPPASPLVRTRTVKPPDPSARMENPSAPRPAAQAAARHDANPPPVSPLAADAGSASLADALRLVQDGLRAMQALQQQTAAAHQRFLEGQALAHQTFQMLMSGQQRILERTLGIPPAQQPQVNAPEPLVDFGACPAGAVEPGVDGGRSLYVPPAVMPVATDVPATGSPAAAPEASAAADAYVAEYQSATQSRRAADVPREAPPVARVASEAVQTKRLMPAEQVAALAEAAPQPRPPAVAPPASASGLSARFADVLLSVVAELTGYPQDMLGLDMDMEADLGIDSIKRVEILAAVQERVPESSAVNPEYMGSLRTLRQIVEYAAGPFSAAAVSN